MNNLEDEVRRIVENAENQDNQSQDTKPQTSPDEIQDIYVLIVREHEEVEEDQSQVVESAPVIPQKISFMPAYAICSFYLFLILSCIAFQAYEILNPPIATVTIIPKSQQITLSGTLQIGRLLQPITISQSATTHTTGHGHQPAEQARGYITFYNGLFVSQTITAGTILTGSEGVQISTDQDAIVLAANPPTWGITTVSAHAMYAGTTGNIKAYDINQGCCATAIKAVNTNSFYGGQYERNYQTVTKSDVNNTAITLKSSLDRSINAALMAQLEPSEALIHPLCSETISPNHNIGDEAIQVHVTVSETCSAIAYDMKLLESRATKLLTTQAVKKLGAGYSLLGNIQISVSHASVSRTSHSLVFLLFKATGKWVYGLSRQSQIHIKELIAGKTKQQALHLLALLPGIEHAAIAWSDNTKLPKNIQNMHLHILVQNS